MAEPITMTATTIAVVKGGAMIATGGLLAELVIFHDGTYLYLSIIGALLSAFGVFHELQINPSKKNIARKEVIAEIGKGLLLGVFAIPFWYLFLITTGDAITIYILEVVTDNSINEVDRIPKDIWMLLTVPLAFRTVPITDYAAKISKKIFTLSWNEREKKEDSNDI